MPDDVQVVFSVMALDFGISTGMDMKQAADRHYRNRMFYRRFVLAAVVLLL